jgi:hypothetical protein
LIIMEIACGPTLTVDLDLQIEYFSQNLVGIYHPVV